MHTGSKGFKRRSSVPPLAIPNLFRLWVKWRLAGTTFHNSADSQQPCWAGLAWPGLHCYCWDWYSSVGQVEVKSGRKWRNENLNNAFLTDWLNCFLYCVTQWYFLSSVIINLKNSKVYNKISNNVCNISSLFFFLWNWQIVIISHLWF